MKKVFCIGEILIDFVAESQGTNLENAANFSKKPGGAPANVAAAVGRLGGRAVFIGAVGRDPFGRFLLHCLQEEGVDIGHAQQVERFTTLAFVSLDHSGERDFVFNRGADKELKYEPQLVSVFGGQVVHFGAATCFLGGKLETAYRQYLRDAKAAGCLISFDPNYRTDLWKEGNDYFIDQCLYYLKNAHFAKLSLEEARLITRTETLQDACRFIHQLGVRCITVTLGEEGTYLSIGEQNTVIGSVSVEPKDTTGAGDAFVGCVLWQLSRSEDPGTLVSNFDRMRDVVMLANRAGAHTTTAFGAIPALPYEADLKVN